MLYRKQFKISTENQSLLVAEAFGIEDGWINNVVDVTNFVLYEIGQPLHAFDLDNLNGRKIIVRSASQDEKFITLDSKERKMRSTDLMICDAAKPVAIAGVMGGENSEVTQDTKNILIESAYFNPSSVRRTAKHLGLSTDASYRFERGTDPLNTVWAAKRAAQLIQQTAGGEIDDFHPRAQQRAGCADRRNIWDGLWRAGLAPVDQLV